MADKKAVKGQHKEKLHDLQKGDEVLVMEILDGVIQRSHGVHRLSSAGAKQLQVVFSDGTKKVFDRSSGIALNKADNAAGVRLMPRGCKFAVAQLGS